METTHSNIAFPRVFALPMTLASLNLAAATPPQHCLNCACNTMVPIHGHYHCTHCGFRDSD